MQSRYRTCAFRAQCAAGGLEAAGVLINKLWPTTSLGVEGSDRPGFQPAKTRERHKLPPFTE